MTETKNILVTGATGNQGGAVARNLIARGHMVRALTRDPESEAALQIRDKGAEVVQGDFDRPDTVRKAANGTDTVFLMSTPYEHGPDGETEQANQVLDALEDAGVPRVVYTSVANADTQTGVPIFDSKYRIERHLQGSGMAHTIVAPTWFRENLLVPGTGLDEQRLDLALPSDRSLQNIEVDEIGRFMTHVLEDPEAFDGKRIDIASDELTPEDMANALTAVTGYEVKHNEVPLDTLRQENEVAAKMFEWFQKEGYSVDIPSLRIEYPQVPWRDFRSWADDQTWQIAHTTTQ